MNAGEVGADSATLGLDLVAITAWLTARLPDLVPPFDLVRIGAGRSNLTCLLSDSAGRRLVLRRPPLGPQLASAHDMAREYLILASLGASDLAVPEVFFLCEDEAVTGAPFFVMEAVDGLVITNLKEADLLDVDGRSRAGFGLVDFLLELRQRDPAELGLGVLARNGAYERRQIARWSRQWSATQGRQDPAIDRTAELLSNAVPEESRNCLVHGDFKLENVILAGDGSIASVLDWELATLGNPLADFATLLTYWTEADDDPAHGISGEQAPTRAAGFPTRQELIDRYVAGGGSIASLPFFRALATWRLAIILDGVVTRFRGASANANTDIRRLEAAQARFSSEALGRAEELA